MKKITAALKINILSLLCIPIFLLSIFFYMLGTAIKKTSILIVTFIAFAVSTLIAAILRDPSEIVSMILILILLGVVISIVVACISVVSGILIRISEGLSYVFFAIGELFNNLFFILIDWIRGAMKRADGRNKNKGFLLSCFMFFIMNALYHVIVKILKYSYIYAGVGSIAILVLVYNKFSAVIMDVMGISLIQYIKLFSILDIISIALIILTVLVSVILIIVSFGFEWSALAISIEQDGSFRYIKSCYESSDANTEIDFNKLQDRFKQVDNNRLDVMQRAGEVFNQYMGTKELEHAFNENNSKWLENLDKISKYIEHACSGVSQEKQITLYWRVDYLLSELENANKNVEVEIDKAKKKNAGNQYSNKENSEQKERKNKDIHYFMGCKDLNSLEERRKKLAKIYHPDTETGDTESFQVMMHEYEELKSSFS